MTIRLQIKIYSSNNKEGLIYQKEYESKFVPSIGSKVKDSIFAESKKVEKVLFNFQEKVVTVCLAAKEVKPAALQGHIQEVAELHKWKLFIPSE